MPWSRPIALLMNLALLPVAGCLYSRHSDTIYAIPRNPSGSLYVTQHAGMSHIASRTGMKVYWNGPRGGDDTQQQIELVEHAIEQHVAGIVITPTAAFALDTVIQRALSNDIPVVILGASIPFPSDPNLSFAIDDMNQSAKIAALRICSGMDKPEEIAVIGIDPVIPGNTALVAAFEERIKQCKPAVHIVSKIVGAFTFRQGRDTTAHLLSDHPTLSTIYSLSSSATRGAVTTLETLHREKSVRIVSADPNLDLILLLRRGAIDSLVFPNMRAMGEQSVENIVARRQHKSIQPIILFAPILVTKENVDSESIQTLLRMDWRTVSQ